MSLEKIIDLDRLSRFKSKLDGIIGNPQDLTTENKGTIVEAINEVDDKAEIFYATYDVATAEEIEAAYQAGKTIICIYNGYYLPLTYRSTDLNNPRYVFEGITGSYTDDHQIIRAVRSGTWYSEEIYLNEYATRSDIITAIEDSVFKPIVLLMVNNGSLVLNMAMGDQAPGVFINHGSRTLSNLLQYYARGMHMEFYLPREMLDGGASDAFADFRIEALQGNVDTGASTSLTLSTTVDGKLYWAVLTPVSETTMTGTLHSMEIPTKVGDLTNDSGFVNATGAAAAAPVQSVNGKTGAVVLNASDVGAGTYTKPSGGIPKTDLASAVQASLGKADTALQKHQSLAAYRTAADQDAIDQAQDAAISGKYTKPAGGIPKSDLASDVQNGLSVVIDFEYVEQDTDGTTQILSTNVTPSEIHSFYQAGRVVMARYTDKNLIMPLCTSGENTDMVMFSAEFNGSEEMIWSEDLTDNTVWYYGSTYMLPAPLHPGHADDGKIQVANNGMWTAAQMALPFGQLDSASTATVMTATIPSITELRDGVCMWLRNGVITSASGVTLNINGLGAKPIYNSLSGAVVTTTFTAASSYLFVYNSTRVSGGCWDMVYGYDTNTTYTPVKLGFGYATCSTAEATTAKTAALSSYTLTTGGIVAVKFANAVGNGATLNINSKGAKAIYYKGSPITAGVIKAGDTVTMIYSTYYHVLSIDRDVDTLPPSPSIADPYSVDVNASPGISAEYARADHVHAISGGTVEMLLDDYISPRIDQLVLPSGAADGNAVMLRTKITGEMFLEHEILSARKHIAYFVIPLVAEPAEIYDFQVVSDASVSKVYATANGLGLQYNGIADGKLYSAEFVLPFDSNQATGTLSVTNLALPSAQGVSF